MRVELPGGQWADLRERITHGQTKAIMRALKDDDLEFMRVITEAFVKDWHVLDLDGVAIPATEERAFDRVPGDIANDIYQAALPLWRASNTTSPEVMRPTPPSSAA